MKTNDLDSICTRCGVAEQATHHPLCRNKDGTPSGLSDEAVRAALEIPEHEAIKQDREIARMEHETSQAFSRLFGSAH